ncbi:MAG: serine hydrolase [bacterium]
MFSQCPKVALGCVAALALTAIAPRPSRARSKTKKVRSKAVLVVSFDGRKVLYQRNAAHVRSIASLSKLMAALVVMDHKLKLDGVTTITPEDAKVASGGCRTRLLRGMKVHNRDLLYAALLASDNRAIPAMGRAVGLGPGKLVAAMNARARKMGLKHTRFLDPVGINIGNVSTSYEIAKILRQAVLHPVLQKVMRTRDHFFRAVWPKRRAINYHNTNALVHRLRFPVYGGKTGYNHKAGYCFASAMRLPGVGPVLAVFLGSTSKTQRFSDFYEILVEMKVRGITGSDRRIANRQRPRTRRARRAHRTRRARLHARRRQVQRRPGRRTKRTAGRPIKRRRNPQLYASDED